ncbi:MAG: ROK family protein [Erysipelotrichaceae bacterium]|nr:ROK family protein [Erysipelotrichaceae bacterium]
MNLPEEEKKTIRCVSVGITGFVDRENAVSVRAFGVWKEKTEIGKILTEELGLPVLLQNNVDAFAQAKLLYGVGRTKSNLLIIKWGPGVGGTVVINDQIYEGRHGRSAEIGHYIVDPRGERCGCGRRGCLETVVSYKALQKILPVPAGGLGEAYEEAPEIKRDAIREKIRLFARCIVNTGTTLAPDRIILCGSLFRRENIREELISACQEYDPAYSSKRIVYTSLSKKEGYIGPLAVFAEELLISGGMSAIH